MNNKISVIYLLGAGRSGTTLMATILNSHPDIQTIGEMHQFLEHLKNKKQCSCGESLNSCPFWKDIVKDFSLDSHLLEKLQQEIELKEDHSKIPGLLLFRNKDDAYLKFQTKIFKAIQKQVPQMHLLDSSKYIARYLLLKKSNTIRLKGIYVIRDVRGVINSFSKQVQTPRGSLSTIVYYLLINFFGQLVCWFDKETIKVKYEDLIDDPQESLKRIYAHALGEKNQNFNLPSHYEMPHIIGGNRMKSNKKIRIKKDLQWKSNISRWKQALYYLLSFPTMIINKYRI